MTPPNYPSNNTLAISDSGANTHPEKQATTTMAPVKISNEMTERLPDGITIESSHIPTLYLPGLRKKVRQIHILQEMKTSPLISLGVLFNDICTIKLYKQDM